MATNTQTVLAIDMKQFTVLWDFNECTRKGFMLKFKQAFQKNIPTLVWNFFPQAIQLTP